MREISHSCYCPAAFGCFKLPAVTRLYAPFVHLCIELIAASGLSRRSSAVGFETAASDRRGFLVIARPPHIDHLLRIETDET